MGNSMFKSFRLIIISISHPSQVERLSHMSDSPRWSDREVRKRLKDCLGIGTTIESFIIAREKEEEEDGIRAGQDTQQSQNKTTNHKSNQTLWSDQEVRRRLEAHLKAITAEQFILMCEERDRHADQPSKKRPDPKSLVEDKGMNCTYHSSI